MKVVFLILINMHKIKKKQDFFQPKRIFDVTLIHLNYALSQDGNSDGYWSCTHLNNTTGCGYYFQMSRADCSFYILKSGLMNILFIYLF